MPTTVIMRDPRPVGLPVILTIGQLSLTWTFQCSYFLHLVLFFVGMAVWLRYLFWNQKKRYILQLQATSHR